MIVLINKDYYRIYEQFGDPKELMIDVLIALRDGKIDMPNKYELFSLPQTGVKRIELNCDELRDNFPPRMIRGLLHWFIDVEGYNQLNWSMDESYIDYNKHLNYLLKIKRALIKMPKTKKLIDDIEELAYEYGKKLIDTSNDINSSTSDKE